MKGVYYMNLYEALKDNPYFDYFQVKKNEELKGLSKEEILALFEKEKRELESYKCRYENPFMNIPNFEQKFFYMFEKGDHIIIHEKIDGSNAHINVQDEDSFTCYSSKNLLNEKLHLSGFYFWCKDHFKQVLKKYWGIDIFGEWLVPHHCEYPASRYGEFYVFDVMENGEYWSQDEVRKLANECGFQYAPVLYQGAFQSWKHIMTFVGKTMLGGAKGEGVVVKNESKLNSTKWKQFYIKIVDTEFQETNKACKEIKTVDMNKVLKLEEEMLLSESIVTLPRVRKIILKLIDFNELPTNWGIIDSKFLLNTIKPYVYKDCIKEEQDIVDKIGKIFGKYCNDLTAKHIETLKSE